MWTSFLYFLRMIKVKAARFGKRHSPQTLFSRSMVILVTPLVLTLGIGLFVFFDRHWSTTTTNLTNTLTGEIALIADLWDQESDQTVRRLLLENTHSKLGLRLFFNDSNIRPSSSRVKLPGIHAALERSLTSRLDRDFVISRHEKYNMHWIAISVPVNDGTLKFVIPEKRLFSTTTYVFLLIMIGSGLLLSIVAVIFMRNQIRPVHKLAIVAEQFGKGIDSPRYRPTGAKEVRQAAYAFIEMRERIKRQIRQRTDMLSGVSHDLRTPLTRLKLQLAMMPQSDDTDAMHSDIDAMERMIKAYLDFAKDETMERSLRCDVASLLNQAISDATRHGFTVHADTEMDAIPMTVRPQALRRVFANILENARLYATAAWVTVNRLPRSIEIIIDDDGAGIPAASYDDVFKPFHRVDAARNQNIEGTGLGLTIARDIIQSHGGTITLGSSPHGKGTNGGLRVTLWLPL